MPSPTAGPSRSIPASRSRHQDTTQAASAITPGTPSTTPSVVIGSEPLVVSGPISMVRKSIAPANATARAAHLIGFARRWRPCGVGSISMPVNGVQQAIPVPFQLFCASRCSRASFAASLTSLFLSLRDLVRGSIALPSPMSPRTLAAPSRTRLSSSFRA